MNQLYPLKFKSIYKRRIWGGTQLRDRLMKTDAPSDCGESWEISSVEDNISVVSEGFLADNDLNELIEVYMGDLVGDKVFDKFGNEFPLLVKLIDSNDVLSIQVHPDDNIALEKHNAYGKTEMWYIIDAEPDAKNVTGLKKGTKPDDLVNRLKNNTLEEILVYETVERGDVFYIQSGRVHATGKGVLFAEIQQTSDITYRLYDYNRKDSNGKKRELHVELALEAIDFSLESNAKIKVNTKPNQPNRLIECPYFTVNLLRCGRPVEIEYAYLDSFVIYLCTSGKCNIYCDDSKEAYSLQIGETILIPALINSVRIEPESNDVSILEVFIDNERE
ncbi:MAG TPA: mannose-6-phosphate isomerase [Salinivirgaceae bacterium]|nr:mannose-6-phosphate isomerase [Salinivirgaceae bacterium]HQA75797.1 mannose-6-phosphate isomerase [Salinivirgaceae bacterium]